MRVCFIDHYDSFSRNLIDWLFSDTDLKLVYWTFDQEGLFDFLKKNPMPLIISPGPKDPSALPETMRIIEENIGSLPIFGICLGHQCLGIALGGQIKVAIRPFHGSWQHLLPVPGSLFLADLPSNARVARYNSLVIDRSSFPEQWISGMNESGEIEAIENFNLLFPVIGVQFHPESFLSQGVESLKKKWLKIVIDYYERS